MKCLRDDTEDRTKQPKSINFFLRKLVCYHGLFHCSVLLQKFLFKKFALKFLCFHNIQIQVNRRDVFHLSLKKRENHFPCDCIAVQKIPRLFHASTGEPFIEFGFLYCLIIECEILRNNFFQF